MLVRIVIALSVAALLTGCGSGKPPKASRPTPTPSGPIIRALLNTDSTGTNQTIVYKPREFSVNHITVTDAHWQTWDSTHAVGNAQLTFQATGSKDVRQATIEFSDVGTRCGFKTFTVLKEDGQPIARLNDIGNGLCIYQISG